jgi:hypothetical protein
VSDRAQSDWISRASTWLAFYAALVGATLGGFALGVGVDALLGTRKLVVAYACSVLLEGVVGARAAGRHLDVRESARISIGYSAATAVASTVLLVWTNASQPAGAPRLSFAGALTFVPLAVLAVVAGTVARAGMMSGLSRRAP